MKHMRFIASIGKTVARIIQITAIVALAAVAIGCPDGGGGAATVPATPAGFAATAGDGAITLTWNASSGATSYEIYRGAGMDEPGDEAFATVDSGTTYEDTDLTNGVAYRYAIAAKNSAGTSARSAVITVTVGVDSDGDGLIEIGTLEELNNIRNNLEGTSYKTSDVDPGDTTGCPTTGGCNGYELTRNLDFADAASYDADAINSNWRPDNADPDMATNAGWEPIGFCNADTGDAGSNPCGDADDTPFAAMFEGNGYTISNLYTRGARGVGLFVITAESAEIRNVGLIDNNSYGGGGIDIVGGLVGLNYGEIIASYATGNANGGSAGGLVGGLVGGNAGEIIASYATGNANGFGAGGLVGGLVGWNDGGTITASYATGGVNGNSALGNIGALVGRHNGGAITASYGFGAVTGDGTSNTHGAPPGGITAATALTATNAGARWNAAASDTMDAWDFGSGSQTPSVRFADYDGAGTDYDCDMFPATLPGGTTITCGTTLIPGQGR